MTEVNLNLDEGSDAKKKMQKRMENTMNKFLIAKKMKTINNENKTFDSLEFNDINDNFMGFWVGFLALNTASWQSIMNLFSCSKTCLLQRFPGCTVLEQKV